MEANPNSGEIVASTGTPLNPLEAFCNSFTSEKALTIGFALFFYFLRFVACVTEQIPLTVWDGDVRVGFVRILSPILLVIEMNFMEFSFRAVRHGLSRRHDDFVPGSSRECSVVLGDLKTDDFNFERIAKFHNMFDLW